MSSKFVTRQYDCEEGLHPYEQNGKWGFIDENQNVVISCIWEEVGSFTSDGLAPVKDDKGFWGYISTKGELAIPCQFRDASLFKDGWAIVEENNIWDTGEPIDGIDSIIDTDGDIIGNNCCIPMNDLIIMFKAHRTAKSSNYEEAIKLILPVAQRCDMDTTPIDMLIDYYIALKQFEDVKKWCEIAMKKLDLNNCYNPYYPKLIGILYHKGLGFEKNPLEAFKWYSDVLFSKGYNEEAWELRNQLLEEHPELKELPEVQRALDDVLDDEEFY